jgi:hypothetical protein
VKFSVRQILASAGGAVIAAIIASLFGFKGTIIGVAIGSAAASFGTVLLAQSIERGHAAVKQVAIKVPDRTTLLRRIGATSTTGDNQSPSVEESNLTEPVATAASQSEQTTEMASIDESAHPTIQMAGGGAGSEPPTEEMAALGPEPSRRSIPWRIIGATAAVVFLLSLGTVTVIELIAGHPLASLFNHQNSNGPSVGDLFNSPPATTTTTSTTTTSTSTTTTTTTSSTTTTTTLPGSSTTTSTTPGQTTTTTTLNLLGTTTTTAVP